MIAGYFLTIPRLYFWVSDTWFVCSGYLPIDSHQRRHETQWMSTITAGDCCPDSNKVIQIDATPLRGRCSSGLSRPLDSLFSCLLTPPCSAPSALPLAGPSSTLSAG